MTFDVTTIELAEPAYLWLLAAPAMLCLLWSWRLLRRALDVRGHTRVQVVPQPHRFSAIGDLGFWFCLILASALCIVALGRPTVRVSGVPTASSDPVSQVDRPASRYRRTGEPERDAAVMPAAALRRQMADELTGPREELYWRFLFAAALFVAVGTCLLRQPTELWWLAVGAGVAIVIIAAGAG